MAVLVSKCPECKRSLRIPSEWMGMHLQCKFCGTISQVKDAPARAAAIGLTIPERNVVPSMPTQYDPVTGQVATPDGQAVAAPLVDVSRFQKKQMPLWMVLIVSLSCFMGLAVVGLILLAYAPQIAEALKSTPASGDGVAAAKTKNTAIKANTTAPAGPVDALDVTGTFPRRLLSICVSNYLYCNPIAFGADQRNFGTFNRWMQDKWKIPKEQTFLLSDGGPDSEAQPPLKSVIEATITRYLETSRAQDRIILLFAGHVIEKDGKGYLVPIEGDLENTNSLIPLEWVYQKLAECKAQQKLFMVDACRFDPGRGRERPDGGAMSDKLDELLKNPPPGVQVWTSCTKGQYSYEFEYAAFEGAELWGGVFLNLFFFASSQGKLAKTIQTADSPLPVETLAEYLNSRTNRVMQGLQKSEQTPRLVGTLGAPVPRNPTEPPPPTDVVPKPGATLGGGLADKQLIRELIAEIDVPPIKVARKGTTPLRIDTIFPFSADKMKKYAADDYKSTKELMAMADKFPLRVATLKGADTLRKVKDKQDGSSVALPEELRGTTNEAAKKEILTIQRIPAMLQLELEEALSEMEQVGEKREDEESKRWQAHYDYIMAQLKARLVYISEYNLMLGKVRKDELPPLDEKLGHKGWRLASQEKLQSDKNMREMAADSRKLLKKLIKEHPGTPWEVLARREQFTALGLQWVASNFGAE